jgi:hypothetical protein
MPTNIPEPTFGDTGFIAPGEQAVLDGAQTDIDQAFGGGLNPALNTPQDSSQVLGPHRSATRTTCS